MTNYLTQANREEINLFWIMVSEVPGGGLSALFFKGLHATLRNPGWSKRVHLRAPGKQREQAAGFSFLGRTPVMIFN